MLPVRLLVLCHPSMPFRSHDYDIWSDSPSIVLTHYGTCWWQTKTSRDHGCSPARKPSIGFASITMFLLPLKTMTCRPGYLWLPLMQLGRVASDVPPIHASNIMQQLLSNRYLLAAIAEQQVFIYSALQCSPREYWWNPAGPDSEATRQMAVWPLRSMLSYQKGPRRPRRQITWLQTYWAILCNWLQLWCLRQTLSRQGLTFGPFIRLPGMPGYTEGLLSACCWGTCWPIRCSQQSLCHRHATWWRTKAFLPPVRFQGPLLPVAGTLDAGHSGPQLLEPGQELQGRLEAPLPKDSPEVQLFMEDFPAFMMQAPPGPTEAPTTCTRSLSRQHCRMDRRSWWSQLISACRAAMEICLQTMSPPGGLIVYELDSLSVRVAAPHASPTPQPSSSTTAHGPCVQDRTGTHPDGLPALNSREWTQLRIGSRLCSLLRIWNPAWTGCHWRMWVHWAPAMAVVGHSPWP